MKKIDGFTRSVLERGTIEGNVLKLPGQLDRADYVKVDKVLKGLGGKWDRKSGGHVFPFDPNELLGKAVENGTYSDRKQDGQMFWTPEPLAERMADLARIKPGDLVLEPSAGIGRLVKPLLARGAKVVAVETDSTNVETLRSLDVIDAHLSDFVIWARHHDPIFAAAVMNPPFTKGQDIAHIQLAWSLLKPGGRLVAISGEGPFFRQDRAADEFRGWLADIGGTTEKLAPGTFRESGTDVATRLIVATKVAAVRSVETVQASLL